MHKKNNLSTISYNCPIGLLELEANDNNLQKISFLKEDSSIFSSKTTDNIILKETITQLNEYFAGTRTKFNIPLEPQGTEFQNKIWQAMSSVPYAATISYKDLATLAKRPKASRAAGMSCNKNPFPVIIPCHRIVGSNGNLTGYAGGLDKKQWLLQFENSIVKG